MLAQPTWLSVRQTHKTLFRWPFLRTSCWNYPNSHSKTVHNMDYQTRQDGFRVWSSVWSSVEPHPINFSNLENGIQKRWRKASLEGSIAPWFDEFGAERSSGCFANIPRFSIHFLISETWVDFDLPISYRLEVRNKQKRKQIQVPKVVEIKWKFGLQQHSKIVLVESNRRTAFERF